MVNVKVQDEFFQELNDMPIKYSLPLIGYMVTLDDKGASNCTDNEMFIIDMLRQIRNQEIE